MTLHDVATEAVAFAEQRLAEAHIRLDLKTIDHLLHPDYVVIQPGGEVETKEEVLTSYKTGTRHWDTAQVDQLNIQLFGDTAIVIGRWQASGRNDGERFAYAARFLSVWINEENHWQNVVYQATDIENRPE